VNYIKIGDYTNIQDNVTIHGTYQRNGTDIGSYVNVGHNAIVHGCTIQDHVLIGMGAIVMDRAVVESQVIIAAGTVVLENMLCESGYLYAGVPAKKIKPLTDEQKKLLQKLPHNYVLYSSWFTE
jgi:carbonic anhydrase/acetyltransferase-like protein (isoleucine patch superfamily)